MPTILRIRGYRIGFYQADLVEPPHVHVKKQGAEAKFWMESVSLAEARGFRDHELNEIRRILIEHRQAILAAWHSETRHRGDHAGENPGS